MFEQDFKFYFGYAYAGKRWGWFWGLWDALWVKDTGPPLASGFSPTKAEAQAQARALISVPALQTQGRLKGIQSFVAHHEGVNKYAQAYIENPLWPAYPSPVEATHYAFVQDHQAPVWSILALEERLWVWYVWASVFHFLAGEPPLAEGETRLEREAAQAAKKASGDKPGQGLLSQFAAHWRSRLAEEARAEAQGLKHLNPEDFLYGNPYPYYLKVQQEWTAHQILGQNEAWVFVLKKPFPELYQGPKEAAHLARQVFQVDRKKLEESGQAYCKAFKGYFSTYLHKTKPGQFHQKKPKPQAPPSPPLEATWERINQLTLNEAQEFLGLKPPYEAADLKRRFRALVFEHHPDHGGEELKFILLERAFELVFKELQAQEGRVSA